MRDPLLPIAALPRPAPPRAGPAPLRRAGPPDPALAACLPPQDWIALRCLPWRRMGGAVLVLAAGPGCTAAARERLGRCFGTVRFCPVGEGALRAALTATCGSALVRRAESRVAPQESCRTLAYDRLPARSLAVAAALASGLAVAPLGVLAGLIALIALSMALSTGLKLAALVVGTTGARFGKRADALRAGDPAEGREPARIAGTEAAAPDILPVISLIVPLFAERAVAAHLLRRLEALDYPRDRLDLCLVLESDDATTRAALDAATLPDWAQIVAVPRGTLRTKPRALNYALDFTRGSIVGIYDAEDAPEPDQLMRVARDFARHGRGTACLQGRLDYYNARQNWLSRCFTLEYAAWFRVLLPGLVRMGLVIPLGGTTLFLRRHAIEAVGGWDAHNVTEDADLGIRLARHGFRTAMLDSTTFEEANARPWPWVRQRSRWLKGYAQTWALHSRRPAALGRDLGPGAAAALQILLLGTLVQALLAPVLWLAWPALRLSGAAEGHPVLAVVLPATLAVSVAALAVDLAVQVTGALGSGRRWLAPWALTLPLYFPLATLAAWKAAIELVGRPFFWDKTAHGFARQDPVTPPIRAARHRDAAGSNRPG
ncbi:glycosyltransferase family 2 protein [Wenxinia saemankumensis]|uniref:Glycosyltransferase, catalytic subunit of cellulose synthase and poly-beta-1,6-N-acetylglucosamine synthase n=1 Tax=Wenxinia saemankumensis TaxID=1447782 RepID=A0A1M6HAY9_9RHOB|nr:glycosyltransferase family 2 protein [Wenxinia saemankumensis]SHJ19392.1 Glycosyltransferase, catalytic subunit of cellulose synthase and poly-beta-1,6-N-acetylglucosamine synthase [Wenxinia saemankumensis]